MARYHRRWNLLNVVAHETGRHTLRQTIFYFNHFLRELPIDTLYVLCAYWTYRVVAPPLPLVALHRLEPLLAAALVAFVALAFAGSIRCVGWAATRLDLLQYRDRDENREVGAHWQMHFVSTLALLLMFGLPATFFRLKHAGLLALVVGLFVALSAVWRVGARAVRDTRWLLHGGREVITFFLLCWVPFAGPLLATWGPRLRAPGAASLLCAAAILALWAYFARSLLTTRLADHAAGDFGAAYLLASHFFEHVLDGVYMLLLMLVLLGL